MVDLRTDTPDSLAWQAERTAETLTVLHGIDGYAELGASVLRYSDAAHRWVPIRAGDVWFQQRLVDPDAEFPAITVRDAIDATPRVVVDINDHRSADGSPIALAWFKPSPDGAVLAYGVTTAGKEITEVFLVDVKSGRPLANQVAWNIDSPPSWLPDSSGFWCTSREITADAVRFPVRRFVLDEPGSEWTAPLPDDLFAPRPQVSRDGRHVAISTGNTEIRIDHLITEDLEVRPFLDGVAGAFRGPIDGDTFYALTDHGAPRGRVVAIPLATSNDPDTWTEILAESADALADFEIIGDSMVVAAMRECSMQIDIVDLATGTRHAVPLPGRGGIGAWVEKVAHPALPVFERGNGEICFVYSDLAASPAVYRYVLDEKRLQCLEPSSVTLSDTKVSYITAVSADGTEIPAHVIHRADLDLSQPNPTLLSGYGGFHAAELPAYAGGYAAWVQAGGIYVQSHLRGGGEFGADWWRDGSRDKKHNTFDDLYAVAEKLIELGWTSSDQLAVYGASNGGLLTAVAVTQRPELWAAVVSDVPVTDLLNMHENPLTYLIGRVEYGDPQIPEERAWLAAIDPLSNARSTDYPPTLVIAGANDPRCPAAQARLFADVLNRSQTGPSPIQLRVHADQGHGTMGRADWAARLTEILAFCATHTGLKVV